jgi:hypothetical protein
MSESLDKGSIPALTSAESIDELRDIFFISAMTHYAQTYIGQTGYLID